MTRWLDGAMTSADVSARVAWADDAPAIAAVQVRAWRTSYADLLPAEVLASLDPDEIAERLARGARPARATPATGSWSPSSATWSPASWSPVPRRDPDCDPVATGELTDLTVDPHQRGAGHGSRLLQAGADTLVADRFTRAVTWLPAGRRRRCATFLTEAGWGPDGAHRTLDLLGDGSTTVKQVRLHTALVDPSTR